MKKFNNRPNKSYKVDDKLIWESRSVALVGVVLAYHEKELYVLISQRGKGSADYQGLWNVPCGYLDWDENGTDGICREVYEETGLELQFYFGYSIDKWLYNPFYVNTDTRENRQNVSLSYGVVLLGFRDEKLPELTNENSEPDEVEQSKWVKISEIDDYQFAFCHDRRIKHFVEKVQQSDYASIIK